MSKMFRFIVVAAVFAVVLGMNAAAVAASNTGLLISQVLYIPAGTNSGGEAVELYNPASSSVDISGWVLATETSPTDATMPDNAVICGGCYYLVADVGWSVSKDGPSWPNADYEEAITLANSDAGVALKDKNGTIMDAVGWGNPVNIGAGLYEGTPSNGSASGNSLIRKTASGSYVDTNNNANDFVDAVPVFHNSSSSVAAAGNAEIRLTIIVSGSAPAIKGLSILADDDQLLPGTQISPVPKSNRTVTVEAVVSDANGVSDISNVSLSVPATITMTKKQDINATAAVYTASFNLSSSLPPGNRTLTATATDASGLSSASSTSFEYLSLIAFETDSSSLVLLAAPGISAESGSSEAANITLVNSGNVELDFEIWATNFTSHAGTIAASNLQYAFRGDYADPSTAGTLGNAKARKDVNLAAAANARLGIRTSLPRSTSPGNYTGIISLVAVNSG